MIFISPLSSPRPTTGLAKTAHSVTTHAAWISTASFEAVVLVFSAGKLLKCGCHGIQKLLTEPTARRLVDGRLSIDIFEVLP